MKRSILALAASTFITGAILTSCNSPEEKVEDAKENVIEAKEDLDKAQENYLIEIENYKFETAKEFEANDKKIAELEAKMERVKANAKADYKKKVGELKQQNKDMREKMDSYKAEGREQWESFRAEFKHDMDQMGNSFKDLGNDNVW